MNLPFTKEEFFNVFASYNNSVYPIQYLFVLLAISGIAIIFLRQKHLFKLVLIVLAVLWAWVGAVYQINFFSPINPIAKVFGMLFIVQAILTLVFGVILNKVTFTTENKTNVTISGFLILYALVLYPLITISTGHPYPYLPTFGVPCPTTIYTIALLMLTDLRKTPKLLFVIPVLWTIIATTAAIKLDVYADTMLIVSSILLFVTVYLSRKTSAN